MSEYANQVKVVFPTKVVCLSETCSETECGPEVAARDIEKLKIHFGEVKDGIENDLHVLMDQWTALVEPFLEDIVASEKASAEKMILPPQMVVPWTTALKEERK